MKYPVKVSVIMPCFNYSKYIGEAIWSILNQSLGEFEFIIINDGSTDNTEEIILSFSDPRIRYFSFKVNEGNYAARNFGMRKARGKYMCVFDSDDIAYQHRLKVQYSYLQANKQYGAIGSLGIKISEDGRLVGNIITPIDWEILKIHLLDNMYILHPTFFIRSHLVKKFNLYYNEQFPYAADYDLAVRCSHLFKITNLPHTLLKYREHSAQISKQKRMEQVKTLNAVRRTQLEYLGLTFADPELDIYFMALNKRYLYDKELSVLEELFNKILEANAVKKLFNQDQLHKYLHSKLTKAEHRNNLSNGWALEKDAINFILRHFTPGKKVLEFGSGLGTEALLRTYDVTSIEHDKRFAYSRAPNHHCYIAEIKDQWYDRSVIPEVLKKSFDLIIVDGPPSALRKGILKNMDFFKDLRTPIIFDDMHRDLDRQVMEQFCDALNYKYEIHKGVEKSIAYCFTK
jgi:glycosyltransferase involved in cell wall biosynthesis